MSEHDTPATEAERAGADARAQDAAALAGGSSITLLGILSDRGLKWVVNYLLTWLLGSTALYGLYATTVKALVPTASALVGLGLDTGVVYFDARYRQQQDPGRLKGMLILGSGLSLLASLAAAAVVLAAPGWLCALPSLEAMCQEGPAVQTAARWGAAMIVLWTMMLFLLGALQARRDMRSRVLAFQIILPVVFLGGVLLLAAAGGLALGPVLAMYTLSLCVGLGVAAQRTWRHYGTLMRDRSIQPVFAVRELMEFSLPQSLAGLVFRLNLYLGALLLIGLAGAEEAALYDVAAGLAVLGTLPVNAAITMFNPMISALFASGERERLDALLKTVTRWLVLLAVPVYLPLVMLPDLVLAIYRDEYRQSALPLVVLCAGQLANAACAPAMRLIPMSGHTLLNFLNGLVAAALNVGLCVLLIPAYGVLGAALATSITLIAWGAWRVVEVWWMFRCLPFTPGTAGLLAFAVAGTAAGWALAPFGGDLPLRVLWAAMMVGIYLILVRLWGKSAEDRLVLDRLGQGIRRRLDRVRRKERRG